MKKRITNQQILVEYFKSKGCKEATSKTSKYITVKRPDGKLVFLGKSGAIRIGEKISDSYSVSHVYDIKKIRVLVESR